MLREKGKRKSSLKRQRALLMSKKGGGLWTSLRDACQRVLPFQQDVLRQA